MRGNARRSHRIALSGAAVLLSVAFSCPPDEEPLYDVADVQLSSTVVHALAGSKFTLHARLFDSEGNEIPSSFNYEILWESNDEYHATVTGGDSYTGVITALAPVTDVNPTVVRISARVLDAQAWAFVTVLPNTRVTTGELITGEHTSPDAPARVLADGLADTCQDDKTVAFAGAALLQPDFTAGCPGHPGELAEFAVGQRVTYYAPFDWSPGDQVIVNTEVGSPYPAVSAGSELIDRRHKLDPHVVPLRVWNAAGAGQDRVDLFLKGVNGMFNLNRAGVLFELKPIEWLSTTYASMGFCGQLAAYGNFATRYADGVVNVFLVTGAADGNEHCPEDTDVNGNPVGGPVILIVEPFAGDDDIAHEIGHAFHLVAPNGGHTNGLEGFDKTNVMQSSQSGRTHFSIGQAFRMSLDVNSWLNVSTIRTETTLDCGVIANAQRPCPRLNHQ